LCSFYNLNPDRRIQINCYTFSDQHVVEFVEIAFTWDSESILDNPKRQQLFISAY